MFTRILFVLVGLYTVELGAAELDSDRDGLSDYRWEVAEGIRITRSD